MKLLRGKKIADRILQQLKKEMVKKKRQPGLAVILVGKNPASQIYVKLKKLTCQSTGIKFILYSLPTSISEKKLIILIKQINQNKKIHGLIIQLPLPKRLNPNQIIKHIDPQKDVDGFQKNSSFISPAHQAILELLKATKRNLKNKSALMVVKNPVFALPLMKLLRKLQIRSKIKIIKKPNQKVKLGTNILIVMLGWPNFIKPEMIEKNTIIIDCGYNRRGSRAVGDVDPACYKKSSFISPVPGGVGPLTVVFLLKNTVRAAAINS